MNLTLNRHSLPLLIAIGIATLTTGCSAQDVFTKTSRLNAFNSGQSATQEQEHPGLKDPTKATETAPKKFRAKFVTTAGDFTLEVNRAWAPNGADRFYNMIRVGYFNDIAIFRAIDGFMFQFGIHGDPAVSAQWSESNIKDDPAVGKSNIPGTISFAQTSQPNSRSIQMFVNLGNNASLDTNRPVPFVPFGKVVEGMDVVRKINTEYGENPRRENIQGDFKTKGNAYIKKRFPNLDYIKSVKIVPMPKEDE